MGDCRCDALQAELTTLRRDLDALTATQPLEPLFSLDQAALLIPCSRHVLDSRLVSMKALLKPAVYRWDRLHRSHRLLYASDLMLLRPAILRTSRLGYRTRQAAIKAAA